MNKVYTLSMLLTALPIVILWCLMGSLWSAIGAVVAMSATSWVVFLVGVYLITRRSL